MTNRLGLTSRLAAAGIFLITAAACSSSSNDGTPAQDAGSAGSAGTGGTSATGGMGGTSATGGMGGTSATGGMGGTSATGGTGGTSATGGTGGTSATGGAAGASGTAGTGGGAGAGGGDDDNDCAHATDISSTAKGSGVIDPPDEADFYSFPFSAGDWVIVRATTTMPAGQSTDDVDYEKVLDTTVTIYDETGTEVFASMDDAYPRFSTDTELVWHVPADGTYCIRVTDWASWAGEARPVPPTGEYFEYELGLYSPDPEAEGNVIDEEPNDSESEPQIQTYAEVMDGTTGTGNFYSSSYGMLESDADVDVYQFTMPPGTVSLSAEDFTTPIGPGGVGISGNGSTLQLGLISIGDTSGNLIAQLDATKGSDAINVPLDGGTDYLLWVERDATTTADTNDFYNLLGYASKEDNPRETETTAGSNDDAAGAETVTLTTSTTDPNTDSGYVLGFISATSDVDYFSFQAEAGDKVSVACGALRSGSGLLGATFAIHDGTDAEMQTETETETADIFWSDTTLGIESMPAVPIVTAGTHFLVVSATGQSPTVTGNYYRCGIYVETP